MILVRTQYSLNKDHQRPKWQPHKSWTLYQDFQDAQDKQRTQYHLTPRSKWKMDRRYWKFASHSLTMFIWVALKENVRLARILCIIAEVCSNEGFLPGHRKNVRNKNRRETWCRNDIFILLLHGRACEEMRGKILRTCEWNNSTMIQSCNAMQGWSSIKKKKLDQFENCQKNALKLSWNVYIWHVLGDLIFYGLWTNLLVRSQMDKSLCQTFGVRSLTFIIQVNTDNIVMWETQNNNAD